MILIQCILHFENREHTKFQFSWFIQSINQSIIVFCPRAGLSLQTQQHSPLFPLLSLSFHICIQSIYHDIVYHLISSVANLLPVYHSFQSILQQAVPSQPVAQPVFFPFISSIIILPSPIPSSTTEFFILSVHFTRSILLKCFQSFLLILSQCPAQGQVFHCKLSSIIHSTLFSAFLFVASYSPFIIMLLSDMCFFYRELPYRLSILYSIRIRS